MDIDEVLIDIVIQEEGLYVYNMHNIVRKHYSISIAPERSQVGSLVFNIIGILDLINVFKKRLFITLINAEIYLNFHF
jgi:hypothetical protein